MNKEHNNHYYFLIENFFVWKDLLVIKDSKYKYYY